MIGDNSLSLFFNHKGDPYAKQTKETTTPTKVLIDVQGR